MRTRNAFACNRTRPSRRQRRGFNLVEMLVVCGILALLTTLIAPSLSRVGEIVRRTECKSNVRGFASACHIYSTDQAHATNRADRMRLPPGRVDDPEDEDDADNYLKIREDTYNELRDDYNLTQELATCSSLGSAAASFTFDSGKASATGVTTFPAVYMGMIYWGGREDVAPEASTQPADPDPEPVDPSLPADTYNTWQAEDIHKRQDEETERWYDYEPTSRTLITCMAFDVFTGSSSAPETPENMSCMPHSGSSCDWYPSDQEPKPFDGIVVGYIGGTADWVAYDKLRKLQQAQVLYYDPQ